MNYDEKYSDEVLRSIDGTLATCVQALRSVRDSLDEAAENVHTTHLYSSEEYKAAYADGLCCAMDEIDDLIKKLIDACTECAEPSISV